MKIHAMPCHADRDHAALKASVRNGIVDVQLER
jgi:hypothetical protein